MRSVLSAAATPIRRQKQSSNPHDGHCKLSDARGDATLLSKKPRYWDPPPPSTCCDDNQPNQQFKSFFFNISPNPPTALMPEVCTL